MTRIISALVWISISGLLGVAFVGDIIANCNEAGWNEECLDACDQALAVCTTIAEADYYRCVYYYNREEAACHSELMTAFQDCQTIWIGCEQTCRC